MHLEKIIPILQLAIGPVIVISGVGLLLLSMTNRFGRVIDRSRLLAENENESLLNKYHIREQLAIMMKRAYLLRASIACVSICLLLDALLIITLFLCGLTNFAGTGIVTALFIGCMLSLIVGLLFFIMDINVSLAALRLETDISEKRTDY